MKRLEEAFRSATHFRSMTGLRFICVLGTIAAHVPFAIHSPRVFESLFLGVDMFFVISGLLIVTLLLRERDKSGSIDLRAFYERRTLRIFPIYYLLILGTLAFALVISPWAPNTLHIYALTFPVMLLYLQDLVVVNMGLFSHTWSLAIEEQFYLVWPSIEKFGKRWLWAILILVLIVSQASNFGLLNGAIDALYGLPDAHERPLFLATFTPILLGVVAAHALHSHAGFDVAARLLAHFWAPVVIAVACIVVCELAPATGIQGWPRLTLHILFCLFLVSIVITPKHAFSWLFDNRAIEHLGAISYGIYIYHIVVLEVLKRVMKVAHIPETKPLLFAAALLASIGVAELSFRFIEKPLIARKGRWLSRPTAAVA